MFRRSGTEPDFIRFDTMSGESPTPSPGRVPCVRARQHSSMAVTGSAVPFMTAAQAAGSARADGMQMVAGLPAAAAAHNAAHPAPTAAVAAVAHPAAAAAGQHAAHAAYAARAVHRGMGMPAPVATLQAFDPNDLAAMNARLAAGLASLPPPPPSGDEPRRSGSDASGTCRQGCSNDTDGGATASGSGGSRKRRERSQEDGCRLRGGGDAADGDGIGGFGGSADGRGGGSSDGDSGPRPAARPMKVVSPHSCLELRLVWKQSIGSKDLQCRHLVYHVC